MDVVNVLNLCHSSCLMPLRIVGPWKDSVERPVINR